MDNALQNILVTGGAGYIGSHTCKALAARGMRPITFDSLVNGHREAVRWGPFVQGDLQETARLTELMREHRVSAIIHFASLIYVGVSMTRPDEYYLNNVTGSLSLLQAARAAGVSQIVFSSTAATYGIPEVVPILEDSPKDPVSPYGSSKLMVEKILQDFGRAFGIRSVSLRYFNAAGASPDGDLAERHDPETHLIPLALQAVLHPGRTLTIHGEDYPTPDGTCVRDYIHVCDLADAHVLALEKLADGTVTSERQPAVAYNLGNGKGYSVQEVLRAVERATGKPVPVQKGPRREGDPAVLIADSAKARRELGWKPRFERLEDIVESAYRSMV